MTAPAATVAEFRRLRDLEVLAWPVFDGLDVDVFVTTTRGGESGGPYASLNLSLSVGDEPDAVLENRRRVAGALGTDLADFVFARQVHSGRARVVTAADRGAGTQSVADAIPDVDALITADPGTALVTLVGDCVPIVLYDPVAHVLACVHAGWRGTVARITHTTLNEMAALGARRRRVLAGIGPAIAPDRYQVGDEVAAQVRASLPDGGAEPVLRPDGTGRWLLDLWTANRQLLTEAGVPAGQIQIAAVPTGPASDPPGMFFSDRTARPCGRFGLVARLHPREGR